MTVGSGLVRGHDRHAGSVVRRSRAVSRPETLWDAIAGGVQWDFGYVAFLYYIFVIITYWLPFADIAIVVCLLSLVTRLQDVRMSPFLWSFAAFAAWCFLSYLASPLRAESWQQTNALLKLWLICLAAYAVIRSRAQLRFFLVFSVGAFLLFPARGAFINFFGGYNVLGRALWNFAYANPNDLAAYALLFASMSTALVFELRPKILRLGALGVTGVLMLLILFTQSRGAMLAAGVVGLLFLLGNLRNPRVLAGAVGLLVLAAALAPRSAWERFGGLANASVAGGFKGVDQERSAEQRFQLLQVASKIIKDNMVFGVGPGVYSIMHGVYARDMGSELPLARGNRDAHNTIMRTTAETGVVGFALFVVMIGGSLIRTVLRRRRGGKQKDPLLLFLYYGVIAFLIAGLFGSFMYLNVLYLQLTLLEIAMTQSPGEAREMMPARRPSIGRRRRLAIPRGS